MKNYYSDKLSAERLQQVYEIAPQRVKQYFEAEVNYVLQKINTQDLVLELGCGFGRILPSLAKKAKSVLGIDTSLSSLQLGKEMLGKISNCFFVQMNAVQLSFPNNIFDVVVCIQNGISAFHVNKKELILESIRVTKPNGIVFFSSYFEKFWNDRLEWFRLQSDAGLIGEIDFEKTLDGTIVCKDGFTATTVGVDQFKELTSDIDNIIVNLEEVDESSLFCEIIHHYKKL
ncbi:MAG: class I SAM-dependent methyltransferase [Ignavibacteriales bacterium]|nr:class I SAM-dependent methyltransferase [Ignavibacteriales bacterium]